MNQRGEVATVMVVGVASVGVGSVVVAVSEGAANNATFTLAVIGIITALLSAATWLNRRWSKALGDRITDAITVAVEPVTTKIDALEAGRKTMEDRQVAFQRQYEDDRLTDRKRGREIEAVAERNRVAARDGRWDDLEPLPPFGSD